MARKPTIWKYVRQYSSRPLSDVDMQKLLDIADDYNAVKNETYRRYGGIRGLEKLYPGYTAQYEMNHSGLRTRIGLPAVYFDVAVQEALSEIRNGWEKVKKKLRRSAYINHQNGGLSDDDLHYLLFVLSIKNVFMAVLNRRETNLPKDMKEKWKSFSDTTDRKKLDNYICRQVRKHRIALHTDEKRSFVTAGKAYKYDDHGIYLTTKVFRSRVFVPLRDNNHYSKQLRIRLVPEEGAVEIDAPVEIKVRVHEDYVNTVAVAAGIGVMLTTDEGHQYGAELGEYQKEYADWLIDRSNSYDANRADNPGRQKYFAQKKRRIEQINSYINQELNRFIEVEKPGTVLYPRLPYHRKKGEYGNASFYMHMWRPGYVRRRLIEKCRQQDIRFEEIYLANASNTCCVCGNRGEKKNEAFLCAHCHTEIEYRTNTARNILKLGQVQTRQATGNTNERMNHLSDTFSV